MTETDDGGSGRPCADPDRLAADIKIREALAAVNFDPEHPLYQRFINEFAREGLKRVIGMMSSGRIFRLVQQRHPQIRLRPPYHWSSDDRAEIANEVVCKALQLFHYRGLVGMHWRPEEGATMMTYFIGSCLDQFSNEFRRWLTGESKHSLEDATDTFECAPPPANPDPFESLITDVDFQRLLAQLPPRQRRALELHLMDHSHREIADMLGAGTTTRSVENLIRRAREGLRKRLEGGSSDAQRA